jgi:hypothetical protein
LTLTTPSALRAGVCVQSPAARNARTHKPDERLQILDKTDIKPSSRPYDKIGVMTAGVDESS